MQPKLSVIVPVYNASAYLDCCIGTLLKQSFKDYELLLVNDGSTDNSLEICQRYANCNACIRLFDKPNGGVSSARNMALDHARGERIVFVDSDDKVTEDYLQGLHDARQQVPDRDAALVVSGSWSVDVKSGMTVYEQIYPDCIYRGNGIFKGFINNKLFQLGMPWSKSYDRRLIEQMKLRFDLELSYSEDLIFMLNYLRNAECLIFSSHCNYVCSYNTGGLSTRHSDFYKEYRFLCAMRDNVDALTGGTCDEPFYIRYYTSMALRTLSCLYRPKTKRNRKERLAAIERLANEHAHAISLSTNRRMRLLHHHRYALFDALTAGMYYLRFSWLKPLWQMWLKLRK